MTTFDVKLTQRLEPGVRESKERLVSRLLKCPPAFSLLVPGNAAARQNVESHIREVFYKFHSAKVDSFYPYLLSMQCFGQVSAAVGLRPAARYPLFLEQYLDGDLLEKVRNKVGEQEIQRVDIVEVGNLVANMKGTSHLLFLVFTAALHRAGFKWITFTATRALQNNLNRVGFPYITLANADASRLSEKEQSQWGEYYETSPQVMLGSLDEAMQLINSRPLYRRMLRLFRYRINLLAAELKMV